MMWAITQDTWQKTMVNKTYYREVTVCRNDLYSRDEPTVIFCDPDPVLNFQNSVQVQPQSKLFFFN